MFSLNFNYFIMTHLVHLLQNYSELVFVNNTVLCLINFFKDLSKLFQELLVLDQLEIEDDLKEVMVQVPFWLALLLSFCCFLLSRQLLGHFYL